MFRYMDGQGRTQQLSGEAELAAAIADGRITPTTPFADEAGPWTKASLHPAWQRSAASAPPAPPVTAARPSPARPEWMKVAIIAVPLLLVIIVMVTRANEARRTERRILMGMEALARGEEVPPSLLATPPRGSRPRALWVLFSAAHDAQSRMVEAQRRHGIENPPDGWMSPPYVTRPSRFPQMATYFDNLRQFHTVYADSLVSISEAALRTRAQQARLSNRVRDQLVNDSRLAADEIRAYFAARAQYGSEARRLHELLLFAERRGGASVSGGVIRFTQPYPERTFNIGMQRLKQLEARMDSLEQNMARKNQADLLKLIDA